MEQPNIMLVEDEVVVSADIKAKLEKMGYRVVATVRYGEKALATARQTEPDLVLMDIRLKGELDGTEAAGLIQEHLDIPVIFLTSYTDNTTIDSAKKTCPYGYLVKPVRLEDLRISLEMSLYKAKMERKLKESELRFRTVADFAYDWETWLAPDDSFLYVSPSCERISGYPPEAFFDNPGLFYQIVAPSEQKLIWEHLQSCHRQDCPEEKLEFRLIRADGSICWLEHVCQPVYSPEGEYLGRRASNRDITCRKKIEHEREHLVKELQEALEQVKQLSGMLPICSFCKRIRDDQGYWNMLEQYISAHSEAKFSHGICEDCARKQYPDLFD